MNLIVKLPGQRMDLNPILVAAHYDGLLGSPDADDNASAVAALLELGRRWTDRPPVRPVWLVAFDQEEWGMLGSKASPVPCKGNTLPNARLSDHSPF